MAEQKQQLARSPSQEMSSQDVSSGQSVRMNRNESEQDSVELSVQDPGSARSSSPGAPAHGRAQGIAGLMTESVHALFHPDHAGDIDSIENIGHVGAARGPVRSREERQGQAGIRTTGEGSG